MTEGRLETTHNLRPKNWDNRRHWTNWHHLYDCEHDHIARESAPFHDLRAGGQFQYENCGAGPHTEPIEPQSLNNRQCGDRMDFAPGRGTNMGGWGDLPLDTEPGRPTKSTAPERSTAVFTKKKPLKRGLFSEYPYMPEGGADDKGAARGPRDVDASKRSGVMKAGGPARYVGQPAEYILDPYNDKMNRGRVGHFLCGPVQHQNPRWMPEGEPERRPVRRHGPFLAGKANGFTIGEDPEWIPDPYEKRAMGGGRRPFRTWHTRTKWSMPTHAPWSTGLATAAPRKGKSFNHTDTGLPNLRTYSKANLTQTIGTEAALSTMEPHQSC